MQNDNVDALCDDLFISNYKDDFRDPRLEDNKFDERMSDETNNKEDLLELLTLQQRGAILSL